MSFCLWITGLPGSGKSTIVKELEQMLSNLGIEAVTLSLDRLRKVLTPEPKYTDDKKRGRPPQPDRYNTGVSRFLRCQSKLGLEVLEF